MHLRCAMIHEAAASPAFQSASISRTAPIGLKKETWVSTSNYHWIKFQPYDSNDCTWKTDWDCAHHCQSTIIWFTWSTQLPYDQNRSHTTIWDPCLHWLWDWHLMVKANTHQNRLCTYFSFEIPTVFLARQCVKWAGTHTHEQSEIKIRLN